MLAPSSVVRDAEFLVALDVEERRDRGRPLIRLASAIEPEWLVELFPERIREQRAIEWNREAERVDAVQSLWYDEVLLEKREVRPTDAEATGRLLAAKALEAGIEQFTDTKEFELWIARVRFAARFGGPLEPDAAAIGDALRVACFGLRSFRELELSLGNGHWVRALEAAMPAGSRRLIDEIAPEKVRLPRGRSVRVSYPEGQAPWIASRLQDFFGMKETPRAARGAVPLVVHLLAPNQRPVQMTTDLAGFWERLYPQLRRELGRRYPKHAWPEKPE